MIELRENQERDSKVSWLGPRPHPCWPPDCSLGALSWKLTTPNPRNVSLGGRAAQPGMLISRHRAPVKGRRQELSQRRIQEREVASQVSLRAPIRCP